MTFQNSAAPGYIIKLVLFTTADKDPVEVVATTPCSILLQVVFVLLGDLPEPNSAWSATLMAAAAPRLLAGLRTAALGQAWGGTHCAWEYSGGHVLVEPRPWTFL